MPQDLGKSFSMSLQLVTKCQRNAYYKKPQLVDLNIKSNLTKVSSYASFAS